MRAYLLPAVAALACLIAFPAFAQADSIVYMKGGQVWIADPSGGNARQFTRYDFHWHSPSEADDGTVVAAGGPAHGDYGDPGSDLYRFSGDGNQIGGAIPTQGTYSTLDCLTHAPTGVRVSPDATKIAYGSFLCSTSEYTAFWTPATATGLDFPNQTLGQQDFYQPAWQDNTHFLVSHAGPTVTSTQARWFLHDVADGDDVGPGWTEDTMSGTGAQGLISRDGTRLAVFEDDAADQISGVPTYVHLWIYTSSSLATAESSGWTKRCVITLNAAKTTRPFTLSPSFSPDGSKLLWADDDGVRIAAIGDVTNNCAGYNSVLLVPGASDPFYSKGNVQPAVANANQPGAPAPSQSGGGSSNPPSGGGSQTTTPPSGNVTPTTAKKLIAKFLLTTKHPRAKHKLSFDASASQAGASRIVAFTWAFGDKKSGKGRKVSHTYKKRGKFKVTLTIRDSKGHRATATRVVKLAH